MSRGVDWSKAGTRLRNQPRRDGQNPDWNWVAKRWKTEAEYWADDLTVEQCNALVACTNCFAQLGEPCLKPDICTPRRAAAGDEMLRREGPRFGGPPAGPAPWQGGKWQVRQLPDEERGPDVPTLRLELFGNTPEELRHAWHDFERNGMAAPAEGTAS